MYRSPVGDESGRRLKRLRAFAWLLDRSIPLGGGWRIGLDPILGLLPGAGDWIGSLLSLYMLYEGAHLGVKPRVLAQMGGNILVEAIIGVVPLVGDLFDFAWQSNSRNLALIEKHYHAGLRPRPTPAIWLVVLLIFVAVLGGLAGLTILMVKAISRILT